MGAPKQKWTPEEEEALCAGVTKYGTGKWKNIQKDPQFCHLLAARSNIDLKDKWRNLSSLGSRPSKLKALPPIPSATATSSKPLSASRSSNSKTPIPSVLVQHEAATTVIDSSKSTSENKIPNNCNNLIVEAVATMKDPTGSDVSAIMRYIEQNHEVPHNFRGVLSGRLRKLVKQDRLEKVHNGYKIKEGSSSGSKTASNQKQKDDQKHSPPTIIKTRSVEMEEAGKSVAYMIADSENRAFMASEAVKEAERIAKMVEESDSLLQFARDIYQHCSRGQIMLMA